MACMMEWGLLMTKEVRTVIEVDIRKIRERYEVFDSNGEFMFSSDTLREAAEELETMESEEVA